MNVPKELVEHFHYKQLLIFYHAIAVGINDAQEVIDVASEVMLTPWN